MGVTLYTQTQKILCPHTIGPTQFGTVVKFNEQGSFVASAPTGMRYSSTTFDFSDDELDNDTVFDNNLLSNTLLNAKTNTYNCFGCGATGDLIKLVQAVEGLNFVEAIHKLSVFAKIDVETVDFDVKYLMKEVSNTIKKYLEKENNSSNYPGGLSEVDFLISFSEKIKKYERLNSYNPKFIAWTDNVYKQIDEDLHKENFKNLNVLWKNFIKNAKIKMGELNEQH
jgi:hypothetical protein